MSQEYPLDSYSNLYLDLVDHKVEKADLLSDEAELLEKLSTAEKAAAAHMRERLMKYLASKHDLSVETHEFAVNTKERKLVVKEIKKPTPAEPEKAEPESAEEKQDGF